MAEIDYNLIFDAITLALHRAFPEARIHGGEIKQDLRDGDYNVLPISASHIARMGNRAQRKVLFDVTYYASEEGRRAECLEKAHSLSSVLGTVETSGGDKLHCLSFEHTVEDNVLHCIVGYPHFVRETAEADEEAMASLATLI